MHLEKQFDIELSRESTVEIVARDETLTSLFPDTKTEIVDSGRDRKTTRTHYTALGRPGTATFHFTYTGSGDDGDAGGGMLRPLPRDLRR